MTSEAYRGPSNDVARHRPDILLSETEEKSIYNAADPNWPHNMGEKSLVVVLDKAQLLNIQRRQEECKHRGDNELPVDERATWAVGAEGKTDKGRWLGYMGGNCPASPRSEVAI